MKQIKPSIFRGLFVIRLLFQSPPANLPANYSHAVAHIGGFLDRGKSPPTATTVLSRGRVFGAAFLRPLFVGDAVRAPWRSAPRSFRGRSYPAAVGVPWAFAVLPFFRAFSGRLRRGWCCWWGLRFFGLVWACFRPVARVALRVACAVAVLARFFAPFSAFRRGGYMRIPPKRKKPLEGRFFCPSCGLFLFALPRR
jgi:hypothetical protein